MRTLSRIHDAQYRLLAAATTASGALVAAAPAAHAANAGDMATTVNGQVSQVGTLLLGGSFLGGLGLVGHGLMKLKAAADSQGREPYGPGVWRFFVGAGLVALPTFSSTFRDTFTGGTSQAISVGTASFQG